MNSYTALNGYVIEYPDPPADVAAHLDRVRAAAEDPTATVDDMLALVYGAQNPLMDLEYFPGRAMVTRKVIENPVFRVMTDLIGAKEMRLGLLDLEKAHAKYTLDLPTVAAELGLPAQAVRAAAESGRLAAVLKGDQWWMRPEAVASFKLSLARLPGKSATPSSAVSSSVIPATEETAV